MNASSSGAPNGADHVFAACRGRYVELLTHFFPGMCDLAVKKIGRGVPDPWRHSKCDGFRLKRDFNQSGLMFFNQNIWGVSGPCINFYKLMLLTGRVSTPRGFFEEVGRYLGLPEYQNRTLTSADRAEIARQQKEAALRQEAYRREAERRELEESARAREANKALWTATVPLFKDGRPNPEAREVWMYFRTRGLEGLAKADPRDLREIRCAKSLAYSGQNRKSFAAMVCHVQDPSGAGAMLHRTYLQNGRKAPVESPKKLTHADRRLSSKCRFIRIGNVAEGICGVAEGVETALSCFLATGLPVYSAVCANLLTEFVPPAGTHTVVVFADKDASRTGELAAKALKERLEPEGYQVFVVLPKSPVPQGSKGVDWNDELRTKGAKAFPSHDAILKAAVAGIRRRGRMLYGLLRQQGAAKKP